MQCVRRIALPGGSGRYIAVHDLGSDSAARNSSSGAGTDLLFVHATGLHGRVWEPLVSQLPPELKCGAVAMDVRGHGDSAPLPEGGLPWEELAADVLAVVEHLHMHRPVAVGHSSGATLLLLAEELQPGTFARLYCIEPIGTASEEPPPPDDEHPLAEGARRRRPVFPSRQAAYDAYSAKPPFAEVAPEALRAYVEHGFEDVAEDEGGGVRLKCLPQAEAAMYANGLSHHAYRDLNRVLCPVVLAGGERSRAVSAEVLGLWGARVTDARVEILAGLGHFAPLEDPGVVARAVTAALP